MIAEFVYLKAERYDLLAHRKNRERIHHDLLRGQFELFQRDVLMRIGRQRREPVAIIFQRIFDQRLHIDFRFDLRRGVIAPCDIEVDRNREEEKVDACFAARAEWIRPGEFSVHMNAHQLISAVAQHESGIQIGDEVERIELNEQVVTKKAVDVQPTAFRIQLDARTVLHRVRRDREIGRAGEPRIIAG